jgi:ATP-dependent RNA helicase DeaD
MLDLGFFEDVEKILARCPSGRQTALFSATMPPPIKKLAEKGMYSPVTIKVQAATLTIDTVEQFYIEVPDKEKPEALARVLKSERPDQAIIFVRTKMGADRLQRSLNNEGVRVKALHGDMSQGSRDGVMIAFKDGRERLLVATDIAARGLDISGVSHVINYDVPNSPDVYVHRIGRTGRVGRSGRAITFITPKQRPDLEAIERHANTEVVAWSANGGAPERAKRTPSEAVAHQAAEAAAAEPPGAEPSEIETPPRRERQPREADRDEARQPRRPRHTKPRRELSGPRAKLMVGAGRAQGLEPADIVRAIVDNSHLEGEDVTGVRVLERFSFAEVPGERAQDVVTKVDGKRVRGAELRVEVTTR